MEVAFLIIGLLAIFIGTVVAVVALYFFVTFAKMLIDLQKEKTKEMSDQPISEQDFVTPVENRLPLDQFIPNFSKPIGVKIEDDKDQITPLETNGQTAKS